MYNISNDEIDFILNDIEKRGVVTEDVRDNILDHVCCIIESEMTASVSFETFYRNTIAKFYLKELGEIEEETQLLLTFKNYHAMKRTVKISGIISMILIVLGAILKYLHLPGAGITIVLALAFFSLVFIPLNIVLKFKDDKAEKNKLILTVGLLSASIVTLGVLFKIMHWPYANILVGISLLIFTFVFIPIYFIVNYRNPETKFSAIINTTFMVGAVGMLFALINLGHSHKANESLEQNPQTELPHNNVD
ncbi:MAG: GldL-related protein [Putridiphycobacter sp.]